MSNGKNASQIVKEFPAGKKVTYYHDDQWWWGIVKHAYTPNGSTIEFRLVPGDHLGYMHREAVRVCVHTIADISRVIRHGWTESVKMPVY